jgi:hypothetical protein
MILALLGRTLQKGEELTTVRINKQKMARLCKKIENTIGNSKKTITIPQICN